MSLERFDSTLRDLGVPQYVEHATEAALARKIAVLPSPDAEQPNPERLPRLGFLHESEGLIAFHKALAGGTEELKDARDNFLKAFDCWRALLSLSVGPTRSASDRRVSATGVELIKTELAGEPLSPELSLAFHLAVTGLLAARSPETRLELEAFSIPSLAVAQGWTEKLTVGVFGGFVRLVRKANGWEDIDEALGSLDYLRELQKPDEEAYLASQGDEHRQTAAAVELVGFYHLAQLVTLAGAYLRDGNDSIAQLSVRLDRHRERASIAFHQAGKAILVHVADLLWVGCRELAQNAIWTHVAGLGEAAQQFARLLASRGRPQPVIELWPSQQAALRRNLLDPYRRAILIEMPTSAGKTLLAKFAIVQTKALNPAGTVAYVVPTRALVNQITLDLRADFREMRLRVEQAVPAFELDPTEERLLSTPPDVLVTTPEKLDLLVRRNHPATKDLALVIADEAHNLRDETRGPRLELLLGTIKREKAGSRFLLLSPFLPNDEELVRWLGDDRALPPISVDWKPNRRVVGAVTVTGRGKNRHLMMETLSAADNTSVRQGMRIPIGEARATGRTVSGLSRATVAAMLDRGSILVLCRGPGTATTRANELAEDLPELPTSRQREAVCRYLETEIGRKSSLVSCIRHGVAFHHAGLSHEARWLIEGLIRRNEVKVVCGTTTLAQGVNFPITSVVVETLQKGDVGLTYQDFWNIAGRAGRALMDTVGVVAFPAPNDDKRRECEKFLQGEATEISSQLAGLIDRADEIAQKFDLSLIYDLPQLSSLLQFLAHAVRVSGDQNIAEEVEDLLRASLVYHQARRTSDDAVQRLVRLCRAYLNQIRQNRGLVTLADQTGFATPSVLSLLGRTDVRGFANPETWYPDLLFGDDLTPLRERVGAIAELPEMRLGQGPGRPFNPERVAGILRDWVRGDSLDKLSKKYLVADEPDPERRVATFSNYLFSQLLGRASWGIGALESISLAGKPPEEVPWEEIGYVPSMIFFGVSRREAVWLRMVGVPRVVADGLAYLWSQTKGSEPTTFDDIRVWVDQLTADNWRHVIPQKSPLTPEDLQVLWREFAG